MKKDRTALYGVIALIGVYLLIQYQKNKNSDDATSSFSNGSGAARKFCKDWKAGGFSSRQDCMSYVSR